jgi:hypothetical protein
MSNNSTATLAESLIKIRCDKLPLKLIINVPPQDLITVIAS